nr:hypothetical protein [Deltaproteobacteria bacterium]
VTGTDLKKLDSTSADVWTRAIPATSQSACYAGFPRQCLAVGADGSSAVSASGGVTRWAADGTQAWSKTANLAVGIAIDGAGTVYVAVPNGLDGFDARRFQADGTELALFDRIGLYYDGELAIDSNGMLISTTSGHGNVRRRRQLDVGMWTELGGYDGGFPGSVNNAIAPRASGGGFAYYQYEKDPSAGSGRYTAAGASWALTRSQVRISLDASVVRPVGPLPNDIAISTTDQVVLGGFYRSPTYVGGYVQSFAP